MSSGGVPYSQDLPPAGGYEPIRYKRNLPARGPGGIAIFGAVFGICAYGFYRVAAGVHEKKELEREKAWSRIHLVPMLMAEGDRDAYRREAAALAREKEIMKDVPGWEAGKSVYSTKRYTPASFVVL
ncbi:GRIM-19 [Ceraceosorus guamensis]|uniref:NADH dehydrogenase [ubiquinone] 1 alpha subcomplex subunit 13 n=1 Tax=Ceraceosorus guamensis TaxID=1522189 RepID=A0A316VUH4_9BASI|nr:GRIM-19 [Ceraceosorus guamensis]PWN41249.1 GRIM-19 [Ceraceosorus guamensis]